MSSKSLRRPCPVCEFPEGELLHTQSFAGSDGQDEDIDFVSCLRCGMVFSALDVDQTVLDERYETDSIHADLTVYANEAKQSTPVRQSVAKPVDAPFNVDRLESAAEVIVAAVPNRSLRVLDAGCATGTFLGMLKDRGFTDLTGIDPSPSAVATARRLYGVSAVAGSFTSPPSDLGTFELITLHHVLEHIFDVQGAVRALRSLLVSGGLVYVEVPDAEHYVDHLVSPYDDFNTEHINHFSLHSLRALMESSGFVLEQSGHLVQRIAGFTRPAVYGIWRKGVQVAWQHERDRGLVTSVERFVAGSEALVQRIDEHLRAELQGRDPVILWGAGQLSRKLLADTVLAELPIEAIVDGNPQRQGRRLHGAVIVAPTELQDDDVPIVVVSLFHERSILDDIEELGLRNPVVCLLPSL